MFDFATYTFHTQVKRFELYVYWKWKKFRKSVGNKTNAKVYIKVGFSKLMAK